ncbi:uncharacterized protein LJ206_020389 [Theristicus caerulescens]
MYAQGNLGLAGYALTGIAFLIHTRTTDSACSIGLSEGFWHHEYWLPPGATWGDMKAPADMHCPQPQDLLLCIPGALLSIVVRCISERTVALPFSRRLGVSDELRLEVQPNATLEGFYILLGSTPKEVSPASQCPESPGMKIHKQIFQHLPTCSTAAVPAPPDLRIEYSGTNYYFVTKFQLFLISCLINTFLMVLQLLHILWSYLIIQMIFGVILHSVV